MYCLAAVCLDAAASAAQQFQEDVTTERTQAISKVESAITSLPKCTIPYLLAVAHGGSIAKLVHLRRALTSSLGENDICAHLLIEGHAHVMYCMRTSERTCFKAHGPSALACWKHELRIHSMLFWLTYV